MTYATGDKAQALVDQMKKAYVDVFKDISQLSIIFPKAMGDNNGTDIARTGG